MKTFGLGGYVGGAAVKTGTAPKAAPFHLPAKSAGEKAPAAKPFHLAPKAEPVAAPKIFVVKY